MRPPALGNQTEATTAVLPALGRDGDLLWVVLVKQRFTIDHGRAARVAGAQVRMIDEPWDPDSPTSSIRYPSDLCPEKPGTDVVLVGEAVAPGAVPVRELDVSVRMGPLSKTVRVFGPRVWYAALGGVGLTAPQPFTRQPIRWEFAFGGMDVSDPRHAVQEPRNPLGRGLAAKPETLVNTPAPHVEDPRALIHDGKSRPPPAGLGALGPQFRQRLQHAGTMNQRWSDERCPLVPTDFDPRFHQCAVPELTSPGHLAGDEPIQCVGLHVEGPLAFQLPRLAFGVRGTLASAGSRELRPVLDTVLLEPNDAAVELTWRAVFSGAESRGLRAVSVWEKEATG